MYFRLFLITLNILGLCWFQGVHLADIQNLRIKIEHERPYRAVMNEAEDGLRQAGVTVADPPELPALEPCDTCLKQQKSFGAYTADDGHIIVADNFDVTSLEGHAALIHEYGHFLLTQAGVKTDEQEQLCLTLGNSIAQKYLMTAMN